MRSGTITQPDHSVAPGLRTGQSRESIWAIPPRWRLPYIALYWVQWFLAMYGVVEFLSWLHPDYGRGQVLEAAMAHIPAVTALGIPATFTLMEVVQRLMVTYDYLMNKYVRPLKEKQRAEGREQGLAEGREQGLAEGRAEGREQGLAEGKAAGKAAAEAEFRRLVAEWNQRRLAAVARNEPFDEPHPLLEDDGAQDD